jgi:phage terminase small subunit
VSEIPTRANVLKIHGKPVAPEHIRPATREWFDSVTADFALEQHHLRLLTLACEAWDRGTQAREELAETGLTFIGPNGVPHAHPSVAIERDSRLAFARILRELDLDSAVPTAPSRPPALRSLRR